MAVFICSCKGSLSEDIKSEYANLPETIDYNFHIKPILSDRCYTCHGPDPQTRKAGLRLDNENDAFKRLRSGNHALVKGSIGKSEVIHRLVTDDPEIVMPPPDSDLTISDREIAMIAKWIEQGSEWKEHWSFFAIKDEPVPEIDTDWQRINPIDNFVQNSLLQLGMRPSEMADKELLIKRVTMDLTGLPPSIEEIDDFLNDTSKDAYERLVNRLLDSDAYAERMAMEWMDLARYSDSHGVSFDGYRTSWPYRDWLINAFKRNLPYDEFITHQIAGDLIEDSNRDSKIATAFLRLNPLEASAGSIPEEFRVEYVNERTGLAGTALLGLTVECAKCHDHKYDPIAQREFFQLSAFFNTTEEYGLAPTDSDRAPTLLLLSDEEKSQIDSFMKTLEEDEAEIQKTITNQKLAEAYKKPLPNQLVSGHIGHYEFNSIKPYKKEIKKKKKKEDKKKMKKDKKKKEEEKPKKQYQELQMLDNNKLAEANLKVTLTEGKFSGAALFNEEYDVLKLRKIGEFNHYDAFSISSWINTKSDSIGSTQTIMGNTGHVFQYHRGWDMALDSSQHIKVRLIHRLPDEIISVSTKKPVKPNEWQHVAFTYDGSKKADGIQIFLNGEKVETKINFDKLKRSIIPINQNMKPDTIPITVGKSNRKWMGDLGLFNGAIDEIKIYDRQLSQWEMSILGEANLDKNNPEIQHEYWALNDASLKKSRIKLKQTRKELSAILDSVSELMVMKEMENPRKTYILDKGLYDQPLDEVQPGAIDKVLTYSEDLPKNRLGLSKWLFDTNNPLVARVAINRYWQMVFGHGIVKTAEDFGSQGERPSHPKLLDWLAKDFMDNNWDIKGAIKQMVMSHTYKQSSFCSEEERIQDPSNKYLARSSSYRWPAEMIRDNALKASGLLVQDIGGPSVKPYQPEGLWKEVLMASKKLAKYEPDTGDGLYRRSLYTYSRRFAPNPFMINFDATSREICTIRRNTTSTPLQALSLLNDPQIVEASRVLSEEVQKKHPDSVEKQIEEAYRLSTGLKPDKKQINILSDFYEKSIENFIADSNMADSLLTVGNKPYNTEFSKEETAALTLVVNTIFNSDQSYMKR